MLYHEVNFDGLVGPTHNYAGLSVGNVASQKNAKLTANPKQAALQGLEKMRALSRLGLLQGVLPPHARPDIGVLRQLGFGGSDTQLISRVAREQPGLLAACYSASAMWTANAATVSPSPDTADGKVHFTAANLCNKFHRMLEADTTSEILKAVFPCETHFTHHAALPFHPLFGDEGAANHTRLCDSQCHEGLEIFVYGTATDAARSPSRYPARQTREASEAIARLHGLDHGRTLFIQQNPDVIDAGVFHNDVIAVGNENVLLCHEKAFSAQKNTLAKIHEHYPGSRPLHLLEVSEQDVGLDDAVSSYLFNSQLISLPGGGMALVAPEECQNHPAISRYLKNLVAASNPIDEVLFFDLRQSMQNGGGPACLRLRVTLSDSELGAVNPACLFSDTLYDRLVTWVERHYRDRLSPGDLADPVLINEVQGALDQLTGVLALGSIYPFQKI